MTNQAFLSSLLKTAQIGQIEIRSLLDVLMAPNLRAVLQSQLREYDAIETEALSIALQRGWDLPQIEAGHRFLTDRLTRMRFSRHDSDSGIADILIRSNTRSMIRELRNLHQFQEDDPHIRILSQKILDCETAGIQRLKPFL